jgi:hypothetical protein
MKLKIRTTRHRRSDGAKACHAVPIPWNVIHGYRGGAGVASLMLLSVLALWSPSLLTDEPLRQYPTSFAQTNAAPPLTATTTTPTTTTTTCEGGLVPVTDKPSSFRARVVTANYRIPRIIHQTSKSRCITKRLNQSVATWQALDDYEYYFHDDIDVHRFLDTTDWSMFFPLQHVINSKCIQYGAILSDIWRYLFLWEFGGVYTDLDSATNLFNSTTIAPDDDAFFIIERDGLLSQYFMAISPKHPLMYYAIQRTVMAILREYDTGMINAGIVSGPRALHEAFMHFLWDQGTWMEHEETKPHPVDAPGLYTGTDNRTLRLVGTPETANTLVYRETIRDMKKKMRQYKNMNMTHFSQRQPTKVACLSLVYQATVKEMQSNVERTVGRGRVT